MYRNIYFLIMNIIIYNISSAIRIEENDKDLPNDFKQEEDFIDKRKRPGSGSNAGSNCNFNKKKPIKVYKTDGTGRTFVDIAYVNVEYNHEYNINCGTVVSGGGHYPDQDDDDVGYGNNKPGVHKPGFGGHHKPGFGGHHKPGFGGHHKPGFGGHHRPGEHQQDSDSEEFGGNRPHRPFLSTLFGNRPLQHLFGQSSESASESDQPGVLSNIVTSFSSILPSPQDFGQGLGDGIASFIQTIPQIGQSFQSLLPDFNTFQFPTFTGSPTAQNTPNPPSTVTPIEPEEMINNEDIKPVHEDHDPVTDPYKNRLRPGINPSYTKYQRYQGKSKQEDYIVSRSNADSINDRLYSRQFENYQPRSLRIPTNDNYRTRNNIRFPS